MYVSADPDDADDGGKIVSHYGRTYTQMLGENITTNRINVNRINSKGDELYLQHDKNGKWINFIVQLIFKIIMFMQVNSSQLTLV